MNLKVSIIILITFLFNLNLLSQSEISENFKFPEYKGYVNDFEELFSDEQVAELNEIIKKEKIESSNEIAIVSISSYYPYKTLFNYSLDLANYWGIGKKYKSNGIIIVFGKQIRQIRIQVGYGLEQKLKDDETKAIIDDIIIPEFKNDKYYLGIKKGLLEIIKEIQ